jgi:ribulose-phosphate 3-epimerase
MNISPSIASANQLRLEEEIQRIHRGPYSDLHIDIEDGNFIPNITFGLKTIQAIRSITNLPFSFHLMVNNPLDYLHSLYQLKPSIIFAHVESLPYPSEFIHLVKSMGVKVGLAFNPSTQLEPFSYLFHHLDGILIMTAEPDGKGQQYIPSMIEKVKMLKNIRVSIEIWVDGGVSKDKLEDLKETGVTNCVMGRAIFNE